jgi:electron transfer flavoprotein beta subunit
LNEDGTLKENGLVTRFDPEDMNALEMALKIKDSQNGKVTVLSLGDTKDVDVLRESLFRGVDTVIRLSDPNYKKLDTFSKASIYAQAIKKIGAFDLIITGVNVSEGENALLGTSIARILNIEQLSYIDNLQEIKDGKIQCNRAIEMGFEVLEAKLPVLISVGVALVKDDPRTPRSAKAALKLKMKKVEIASWSSTDLGINDAVSLINTVLIQLKAISQKTVESKKVDPEKDAELKEMLNDVLK